MRCSLPAFVFLASSLFSLQPLLAQDGGDILALPTKELPSSQGGFPASAPVTLDQFVHPPVHFQPGEKYGPEERKYQGIPSMERAPDGRLWATWYAGRVWEDEHNYVVAATSGDDGKTWSDLKFVIDPDGAGPIRTSDPCFWIDPAGRLWLFWWLNGPGELATVTMAMTTDNPDSENPTWTAPRVICKGVMLNKPIVTRSGEWILPTAIWKTDDSCRVMVSNDQGMTWNLRGTANIPPTERDCDEPMVVERRDGSLWQLVRTKFGIHQSVSKDGGRTWTEAKNCLPNATSRFFLRRLASGNLLLVKHGPLDRKIGRSHLTAYLSDDDGATWKGGLVLDERDNVSYPDGTQAPDGTIYVIYDWERARDKNILMAAFAEADVLEGKFASPAARSRVLINHATGINPRMFPNGKPANDGNPVTLLTGPAALMDCSGATPDILDAGAKLFSDRDYLAEKIPDELRGCKFYRGRIDGIHAVCQTEGVVYVITPSPGRNSDSIFAKLEETGFEKTVIPEFLLFTGVGGATTPNLCSVYQKKVVVGESLDPGKWGLLVVPERN